MPLTLYGFPVSQPARAVYWALLAEDTKFEYVNVMPGKGTKTPEFKAKGAFLSVPRIDDDGFVLNESHAILSYLGEKHDWSLYPKDIHVRAKIQEYFNWHHTSVRKLTSAHFAPKLRKDLPFTPEGIRIESLIAKGALATLNKILATQPFIAGEKPTVADLSCFCEVSQCEDDMFSLTDISPYPNVQAWLARCKTDIPKYKESHKPFFGIYPKIKGAFAKL
eukprot:TRINITY_DN1300_c0_g3_i1.p1 TRINITY_DN1300_c0_g3~~TRINITY_DN1300_c0_g3_i1.p1  ORF type:complete len:221 (+),score=45.12 TRINITY_DN1300_c0_g3_i1:51-713(+)